MATMGEKIRRLHDFFGEAFTVSELEMFLTENGYEVVVAAVNQRAGGTEYFFAVTQALQRRGLIKGAFFEQLRQERPELGEQISVLQQLWLAEDQTDLKPPPSVRPSSSGPPPAASPPGAVDRISLVRNLSRLSPGDMAMLVTFIEGAGSHISRVGAVPQQVAELMQWAESSTGPGLRAIQEAFKELQNP
jgi:hypothetical protein